MTNKDLFGQQLHTEREIEGEEYAGIVKHETDRAILFFTGEDTVWLPRAAIHVEQTGAATRRFTGRTVGITYPATVTIPDRLAREKGLIE